MKCISSREFVVRVNEKGERSFIGIEIDGSVDPSHLTIKPGETLYVGKITFTHLCLEGGWRIVANWIHIPLLSQS